MTTIDLGSSAEYDPNYDLWKGRRQPYQSDEEAAAFEEAFTGVAQKSVLDVEEAYAPAGAAADETAASAAPTEPQPQPRPPFRMVIAGPTLGDKQLAPDIVINATFEGEIMTFVIATRARGEAGGRPVTTERLKTTVDLTNRVSAFTAIQAAMLLSELTKTHLEAVTEPLKLIFFSADELKEHEARKAAGVDPVQEAKDRLAEALRKFAASNEPLVNWSDNPLRSDVGNQYRGPKFDILGNPFMK